MVAFRRYFKLIEYWYGCYTIYRRIQHITMLTYCNNKAVKSNTQERDR